MARKILLVLMVVLFVGVLAGTVSLNAADDQTTGRVVMHSLKTETIEVGDVPGHTIGVAQVDGLVLYPNGEIATQTYSSYFDYVNGKGITTGFRVITFQDGANQFMKQIAVATPLDGGKRSAYEGTFECTGGTGRFEGFKGTGTLKAERIGSLKTGSYYYVEFTHNCKKP